MQQKRNKKTNKTAEQKALEILNYCMRSESELREKLSQFENFSKDDIDRAIEYVSYYGYLNDTVYAELYVSSRAGRKAARRTAGAQGRPCGRGGTGTFLMPARPMLPSSVTGSHPVRPRCSRAW